MKRRALRRKVHRYPSDLWNLRKMGSVLETDFPLVSSGPPITNPGSARISRQASRDSNGPRIGGSSLTRVPGSSLTRGLRQGNSGSVSPAPEWQYEAVSTNSSLGLRTQVYPESRVPVTRPNLNRSSSLRKAYNDYADHSSEGDEDASGGPEGTGERQPLTQTTTSIIKPSALVQTSTHSSATSDYHSDTSNSRAGGSAGKIHTTYPTHNAQATALLPHSQNSYHTKVIR